MGYFWHPTKKILIGYDEGTGCVVELTPLEAGRYDEVVQTENNRAVKLPPQEDRRTRRTKSVEDKPKLSRKVGDAKECCGSKGVRHFKWCKEVGGTGVIGLAPNKSGRIPFSQSTYNTVKALLDSGTPAYAIVSEKGLDPGEVKKIEESKSYDRYFKA